MATALISVLPAIPSLVIPTDVVTVEPVPKEIKSEDYGPMTDSENVEKFVRDYFINAGVPELAEVARCESTFRHYDKNGQVLKGKVDSRDTGVMQINLHYHADTAEKLGLNVHNIDDQLAYSLNLHGRKGLKPWNASKPCWGKSVSHSEIAMK